MFNIGNMCEGEMVALRKEATILRWRRWNSRETGDERMRAFIHRKIPVVTEEDEGWLAKKPVLNPYKEKNDYRTILEKNDDRTIFYALWETQNSEKRSQLSDIMSRYPDSVHHIWFNEIGIVVDQSILCA